MYTYIIEKGVKLQIKTPFDIDLSQIKEEVTRYPDRIISKSTYPNGLILEFDQRAERITVYSNRKLVENPDGSFTAPAQ